MLSIQHTRSNHWTSPADVVLLPSLVKVASPSYSDSVLPPMHHIHHTHSIPALPSITALLQRHMPEPSCPTYGYTYETNPSRVLTPTQTPTSTEVSAKPRWRLSKYCTVDGCERVSQRNGLCHRHGGKRSCKEESCRAKDRGNGYCIRHGGGRPCDVANCGKKARRQGMCTQHYRVVHPN